MLLHRERPSLLNTAAEIILQVGDVLPQEAPEAFAKVVIDVDGF